MKQEHIDTQNVLCEHPDGLTCAAVAWELGISYNAAWKRLRSCPGVYIHHWYTPPRGATIAVYRVGSHPSAPRPHKKARVR